jgi:hypothetical protein
MKELDDIVRQAMMKEVEDNLPKEILEELQQLGVEEYGMMLGKRWKEYKPYIKYIFQYMDLMGDRRRNRG